MIIEAFLRWAETASTQNRAEAAFALGRAYLYSVLDSRERQSAQMALTCLLDDPSPKVRLALAEAVSQDPSAPRSIIMSLVGDQADISVTVISRSEVLTDSDLVDLAGRGDSVTRAAIALRPKVSAMVSAAIAEVGDAVEVGILLKNRDASFTRNVLVRIADRLGDDESIRELLLDRDDLPAAAQQILVERTADALGSSAFIQACLAPAKLTRVRRESCDSAAIQVIAKATDAELPRIVEHLRTEGRLTPAFLIHALAAGRTQFFAEVIANLSGVARIRTRSILASGRPRAVRALVEAAGISSEISRIFCEAVEIWREQGGDMPGTHGIFVSLAERIRKIPDLSMSGASLADVVERLALSEMRAFAHRYAEDVIRDAA